jgi:hypothetical protein
MTYYSEYLSANFDFLKLTEERKRQLTRISQIRGADVVVVATDFSKGGQADISINYSDLLPFQDQLSQLNSDNIDIILETPGGSGETAEEIVKILRGRFKGRIGIIVPGHAMSAGTIIAMAADEILMGELSALGPIDAQLRRGFSAEALIKGFEKIKDEVQRTNTLNKAYIPILQGISPGDLEHANNALNFAKELVQDWLATYKFKNWETHSSTKQPVTDACRRARAKSIADELANHSKWMTHSRPIKISELRTMKLLITDYRENTELNEAISRYYTLLQISLQSTAIYKIFEVKDSQIYRFISQPVAEPNGGQADSATISVGCPSCKNQFKVQAHLKAGVPLEQDSQPFPKSCCVKCPKCSVDIDLSDAKRQIEAQSKKTVITD